MVTSSSSRTTPHVIVIGGGPAGTTVSTLIAQKGYQVVVLERETFPRFHIGESLIPETYWVLERLNMLPKMKNSHFVKKYSVQFISENGKLSAPFYFHDNKPHDCSQTWQVRRSEFDQMMVENAVEHGAVVRQGVRVLDVLFEEERAVGVRFLDEQGKEQELRADVIVDASGQSAMLMHKLKTKVSDPYLNKGSIWTYFEGAHRDEGIDAGATIIMQTKEKKGWFWFIPLHDNITSIGVVADFEYLFKGRGDNEQTFYEEVERCPGVKARIEGAKQVNKIYATKDFTYRAKAATGDGWVMIGDAFGFLDPLYSSGVLLALKSGQLAADSICDALEKGDTSKESLGTWEEDYVNGMNRMRKLVVSYYEGFNFGAFIRKYPDYRGKVTDLLIGDLFKEDLDPVLDSIDNMKAEQTEMAEMSN